MNNQCRNGGDPGICLIGAGLAGLSAARVLVEAGHKVVLLEKSRGLGGRAATRRVDGIPVDHGAQFFTARSTAFQMQAGLWLQAGVCRIWSHGFHQARDGRIAPPDSADAHPRYACADGMTALARNLGEGLDVRREHRVIRVTDEGAQYAIECESGAVVHARTVFCSAPLPQALELSRELAHVPDEALSPPPMDPCLSVIAETTGPDPSWHGLQVQGGNLAWVGADFTKRPGPQPHRFIVLHGSAEFSRLHQDGDIDAAARILLNDAAALDKDALSALTIRHVQRWRYARTSRPLADRAFMRFSERFFFIGDAFLQGTIESAWTSGRAAAEDFLAC